MIFQKGAHFGPVFWTAYHLFQHKVTDNNATGIARAIPNPTVFEGRALGVKHTTRLGGVIFFALLRGIPAIGTVCRAVGK